MRHDAHYVDELESGGAVRGAAGARISHEHPGDVRAAGHVAGARRCRLVFQSRRHEGGPLRERMGLSLARVGVERSMRAFQALRVLLEDPPPEPRQISLKSLVEHTVKVSTKSCA